MLPARLLTPLAPPLCVACGGVAGACEPLCGACRGRLRWLGSGATQVAGVNLWAPLAYEGGARALVGALKYRGVLAAAELMAAHMAANAPPDLLAERSLVPVPLHPARRRRRGFNQAERLAGALAKRTDAVVCDCLRRSGSRRAQVGRPRAERLAAIEGAIALRPGVAAPARVLVIDDVVTTGATLAACVGVLRGAGADVRAIAYARTPGR
ncbi:MAG: ComF family protein [Thermoleophilaceae bacterium]|nr:ComF family protein [Thermoleophilaceae bacterium]